MKYFLLIFFSCLGLNLFAQNLTPGMSPEAVEAKIGKPILARMISIALMWLSLAGLMVLFRL